jgi:hypothetical protein
MARVNPFALYPPSFEAALREVLAVGPPPGKGAASKAYQKRQPTTRKAVKAKPKKNRKKK